MMIPVSPHTRQYLLSFGFFIIAIPTSVRWYLSVVLICIFVWLMMLSTVSYNWWPLVCLLWKRIYMKVLCLFFISFFVSFCCWVVGDSCILDINPYQKDSSWDRKSTRKQNLNNTMDQKDPRGIYTMSHPIEREYTFFSFQDRSY